MNPSYLLTFALGTRGPQLTTLLLAAVACAEQPFDFARTPGKLPKTVVPREYALRIVRQHRDDDLLRFRSNKG
jgi:hypothetical protein